MPKFDTEETKKLSLWSFLRVIVSGNAPKKAILLYRTAYFLYGRGWRRLSSILFYRLQVKYGVYISPRAEIGSGLRLPHPNGIVIGEGVIIGINVTIFQQVTVGGARIGDAQDNFYPEIGDGTVIFAGAKLLGSIKVGKSCVVGANSVVNKSIPDGVTVAGVPAKIIKRTNIF